MDYTARDRVKRTFTGNNRHTFASGNHEKIRLPRRGGKQRLSACIEGKKFPGTILA